MSGTYPSRVSIQSSRHHHHIAGASGQTGSGGATGLTGQTGTTGSTGASGQIGATGQALHMYSLTPSYLFLECMPVWLRASLGDSYRLMHSLTAFCLSSQRAQDTSFRRLKGRYCCRRERPDWVQWHNGAHRPDRYCRSKRPDWKHRSHGYAPHSLSASDIPGAFFHVDPSKSWWVVSYLASHDDLLQTHNLPVLQAQAARPVQAAQLGSRARPAQVGLQEPPVPLDSWGRAARPAPQVGMPLIVCSLHAPYLRFKALVDKADRLQYMLKSIDLELSCLIHSDLPQL